MGKKRAQTMAEIKATYCLYNAGVDCTKHDQCSGCGFNPLVHAQRLKEIKEEMLSRYVRKAETQLIMERIRKKNQSK